MSFTDQAPPPRPKPADHFRRMAESIERNPAEGFGGALLIVPPDGEQPVEILLIGGTPDAARFWGLTQSTVKIELDKLDERQRGQQAGWPSR
jgi:hypothetical protein